MNLLYLSAFVPLPASDGDRVRALFSLCALSRRHRLFGVFLDPGGRSRMSPALRRRFSGLARIPISTPRIAWGAARSILGRGPAHARAFWNRGAHLELLRALSRWPVDAIHVHRLRMMPYAEKLGLPYCLDAADCLSFYYRRTAHFPAWRRLYAAMDSKALEDHERRWANAARVVLVTTPAERGRMRRLGVRSPVAVVPNGVDLNYWKPGKRKAARRNLVFLGNLAYPPNADGIEWFLRRVAPEVARSTPGIGLEIVGRGAPRRLGRLARLSAMPVTLQGYRDDARPALRDALAMLCVLPAAVGIQNKALQAMACGIPVIASANVAGALGARRGANILVADSPEQVALAVSRLASVPSFRKRIGAAGRRLVRARFSFESAAKALLDAAGLLGKRPEG